jgi:quercetin dioxygenase-like cupin family protein
MRRMSWKIGAAIFAIGAGLVGTNALFAQQPQFKRVELQRIDTSTPGWEAVLMRAEFEPKAQVGKHTHPGNEVAYILEGALELSVEGKPPRTLKRGESFSLPANTVHWAKNVANGPTKVLVTYVVEKGKPIATSVTTAMK